MDLQQQLINTRDRTLTYFDLPANVHHKTYGEGKWNVRQLLCHIADAETVLYDRIRRVISEPRQVLWGFDQDGWAEHLRYNEFPLEINKNIYRTVREAIIYLAPKYYEPFGKREYVHSKGGVRTFQYLLDKVVWHNTHHLDQIDLALERDQSTSS